MRTKRTVIFLGLGVLFLLYAILGRYLVLPGYLEGLETGGGTLEGAAQIASPWEVVRYLLWAYSFKVGIYFTLLGAVLRSSMSTFHIWLVAIVGFVYITFAYIPMPVPASVVFGLAGGVMTLMMVFVIWKWAKERDNLDPPHRKSSDFRMAGFFFFAMATYTLCPLLGVKTFALSPEKMIRYGLQAEASSFAFHLLIELVLGWVFVALSFRLERPKQFS